MWTPSSTRWMTPCPASGLLNFSITAAVSEKQRGTSEPENGPRACFGLQRSRSTLVGVQWLVEGTRAEEKIQGYRGFRSDNGYRDLGMCFKQRGKEHGVSVHAQTIVEGVRWRAGMCRARL